MPVIEELFLNSVFYLYPSVSDAESGARSGGSGFFVGIRSPTIEGLGYVYAVTNRHVVENAKSRTLRVNTTDGRVDIVQTDIADWARAAADDLAVMMIPLDEARHRFSYIPEDFFVTREVISEMRLGPGDETFLVGRFVNHEGTQQNTPSVRFGNISMMTGEPVKHDDGYMQESFLVETHSVGGFSGSPVFVYIRPSEVPYRRSNEHKCGPWLLGVDWGHQFDWYPVALRCSGSSHPEDLGIRHNTGMAYVVPSWKLHGLLYEDELVDVRKRRDEEFKKAQASSDSADSA